MLRHLILAASAAVNFALLASFVRTPRHSDVEASQGVPEPAAAEPQPARPPPPATTLHAPSASPSGVPAGYEDIARILELMRAEGLSPEIRYMAASTLVIKRLLAEEHHMRFGAPRHTWRYGVRAGNPSREKAPPGAAHTLQRDDIMLALMGDDYLVGRFPDSIVSGPRFGGISPEKARQVLLIEGDYAAAGSLALRQGSMATALAARSTMSRDKDAEIRAILTPEEYERYQDAASPTKHFLRRGLLGAEVDDAQFATIVRRARPFGTDSSAETLAPFVQIIMDEASPEAAVVYARNTDRSQPSAVAVLESAALDAGEIARRYLVLQSYRTQRDNTGNAEADYESVMAGLSAEQRSALERTTTGSRLKRAAMTKRRTP